MSWCPKKGTAAGRASPERSFVPGGGEEHPKFLLRWGIEIWGRLWGGTRALVHIGDSVPTLCQGGDRQPHIHIPTWWHVVASLTWVPENTSGLAAYGESL